MPKPNNNMFIRNGLKTMIDGVRSWLDKSTAKTELGYSGLEQLLNNLTALMEQDKLIFGDDGKKEPSLEERSKFAELCSNCIAGLETIKSYSTNADIKHQDIRNLSAHISDNYADKIALELKPFIKVKQPSTEWNFSKEEKVKIDALLEKSRKAVEPKLKERIENWTQEHSKLSQTNWVEFPDNGLRYGFVTENIPKEFQLTGDINDLAAFYLRKPDISADEKDYIERRIGTLLHYNELENANKKKITKPVFVATQSSDGKAFGLNGYEGKYQYQTTNNGCWSCAYAMLLESRGISLNQQIIRSFRPGIGVAEMKKLADKPVQGLIDDKEFSPFELADLTTKVLPSTSLRQVVLQATDPNDLKDVKKQFVEMLREAILVQNSPVALNKNDHFVTIVGIDGDNLKVLNSRSNNPDLVDTIKIDDVVNTKKFSLTWLHDLKFNKDGKCTNLPKEFDGVNYSDGKLISQSNVVDPLNKEGSTFDRNSYKGKVFIQDSMYMPDTVPESVYKLEAEKKESLSEEDKKNKILSEEAEAYNLSANAIKTRTATVEKVIMTNENLTTKTGRNYVASYFAHRNILDKVNALESKIHEPSTKEKVTMLLTNATFSKEYNKVRNSAVFNNIAKRIPATITDTKKLEELYKSYQKENKKFEEAALQSETRVLISSEISDQLNKIKRIVGNWDNISEPIDKLRLTVATMLAKRTLLDAFDNTNDPDKEKNFDAIRKNPNIITDISESASFKDFYLNIKSEEILKLCECSPEDSEIVVDNFYHKFIESLSKPRIAKEASTEQKSKENPEIKKTL